MFTFVPIAGERPDVMTPTGCLTSQEYSDALYAGTGVH
jgi:hypothetical protein